MANLKLIVEQIGQARLPALYPFWEFVEAGGLMAYTIDLTFPPSILGRAGDMIE
jgi:putative ABC transport system substrate-binding protein